MKVNYQCDQLSIGQISMDFPHRENNFELCHRQFAPEEIEKEARLIGVSVRVYDTQLSRYVDEPTLPMSEVLRWANQAVIINTRSECSQTYVTNTLLILKAWIRQHSI